MVGELSDRQEAILEFIKRSVRTRGYPPSVREIGEAVGLSSSSTVHAHLAQLERKGYIRRDPAKPRAIEINEPQAPPASEIVDVPVLGRVAAGNPILAVQEADDFLPLPLDFVRSENAFLLKVRGDSMVNAGILDGDLVLVRPQPTAQNGDIVVALLEDETTVKRFYRERDAVRLQPENPAYEPIISSDVQVIGRVTGVLRRLD